MKFNHKFLYLSLSSLFVLSSCSNDDLQEMSSESTSQEITILATQGNFSAPESRTVVDKWYDGDGGIKHKAGLAIQWEPSDKIGVFGAYVNYDIWGDESKRTPFNNQKLSNTKSNIAFTTDFKGKITVSRPSWAKAYIFQAYYPYNANNNDLAKIPVSIDMEQTFDGLGALNKYDYKASNVKNDFDYTNNLTYSVAEFQQMTTLLRFVIDKEAIVRFLQSRKLSYDGDLTSITVGYKKMGTDTPSLTGNFTYDLSNIDAGLHPSGSTSEKLIVKPTSTIKQTIENHLFDVVYAVVAPVNKQGTLQLSLKYGKHTITLATEPTVLLKRGCVYSIGITSGSLKDAQPDPETLNPATNAGNQYQNGGDAI